jgi:hypothetical protein
VRSFSSATAAMKPPVQPSGLVLSWYWGDTAAAGHAIGGNQGPDCLEAILFRVLTIKDRGHVVILFSLGPFYKTPTAEWNSRSFWTLSIFKKTTMSCVPVHILWDMGLPLFVRNRWYDQLLTISARKDYTQKLWVLNISNCMFPLWSRTTRTCHHDSHHSCMHFSSRQCATHSGTSKLTIGACDYTWSVSKIVLRTLELTNVCPW